MEKDPWQLDLLDGNSSAPIPSESFLKTSSDKTQSSHFEGVPRTLLILDTETTGVDPDYESCIEVGAILFDVPSRTVLSQQSFLLPVEKNGAEMINRIPAEITLLPQPWEYSIRLFELMVDAADVLVAHNAEFDRQWFGKDHLPSVIKPWLCTMEDIRWPYERQLRARPSLRDLAIAYGVPVWAAHRALTDCIYLAEVFSRCDDLEYLLERGLEPKTLMRANVSYENRFLAKEAGFTWNHPVKGAWTKRLSSSECIELKFDVVPIGQLYKSSVD